MEAGSSQIRMGEIVRYPRSDRTRPDWNGIRNLFTIAQGGERNISLESGINPIKESAATGLRPAILLSSSPWKAGTASTPWHDIFDLDRGHVRYFGDHKATTTVPLGQTRGNSALLKEFDIHRSTTPSERNRATPLLLFRAVTHEGAHKGYREFCGVGVLEAAERVVQLDPATGRSYTNYVFDIAVLDLGAEEELLNWSWINDRRTRRPDDADALRSAPSAWRRWVAHGNGALPALRRRVSRSSVLKKREQLPETGTQDARTLERIYRAFDGNKHAFESLASRIVGKILSRDGAAYHPGWITKASGDQGVDFVSRVDLGFGPTQVKLVVLGQAKCVTRDQAISAGDLARVVARLRRGWIGAFVTTSSFSEAAQEELADDEYPILLVHGLRLAQEARQIAAESYAGDLESLLAAVVEGHSQAVTHRRPEEILNVDGLAR